MITPPKCFTGNKRLSHGIADEKTLGAYRIFMGNAVSSGCHLFTLSPPNGELRPAPLIGELTSKLIQCLLRSTYGKDLLVSHLQLEKRTYISSTNFKRLLTLALTFKNFSSVCDQLYRIEHVSHVQILRYIEDVIKSDDQRVINQRRSFMIDNTEDETNSMTYDNFMQNALSVFIGKPTGPASNVHN
ncbi:hypothetical protein CRM22_005371 [Opisthorchis felineus]|uniref:Uncharacterized protein n=1 Tax=Opisthorchis felineus TaxID=147828 RepID=A0A4S2LSQ6_OPIFE|nr:hypothetical protein CRM22_005371 [Opisthorchis felineus]